MRALLYGFGSMGRNHFRVLKKHPQIKTIDIYDLYADVPDEHRIENLDNYLKETPPDFAIVVTPTVTHRIVAEKLLNYKIPLLIEKPLTPVAADAEIIIQKANEGNTPCAVGFVERFNPVVHALKKEITESKILSISINRVGPFPPRIKDVGVLVDLSVHDIDLVRFLLGGAEIKTAGIMKSSKNYSDFEDNAIIGMKMEGDIIVNLITNWLTPFKKRTIEVATESAYYEANLLSQELKAYSHYEVNNSFITRNCFVERTEPLFMELSSFINLIKRGDRGDLATLEDGLKVLNILENRNSRK